MNLTTLIDALTHDTLRSAWVFTPELTLCGTIVLMLLLRILTSTARFDSFYVALAGSAAALTFAVRDIGHDPREFGDIFTGFLVFDSFTIYFRVVLLFFAVVFAVFTRISGIPDRDSAPDFYTLSLGATLGMCLMASANHLLMVFLAVEMASVPSYCLAGMLKGRRKSSEAALKYAVYGAGAAGIMLYGISLLAGILGTVHIPTMTTRLAQLLQTPQAADQYMVLVLAGLMIMVGLAFKLSAVPFHFWCPDVFEGASAEVNAFLSVASKAAALALLVRVAIGFGFDHNKATVEAVRASQSDSAAVDRAPALVRAQSPEDSPEELAEESSSGPPAGTMGALNNQTLAPVRDFIVKLLAFLSAITCTFGNLAAYGQSNLKRLLAYSTIAHAGYMIMPVAAAMAVVGSNPHQAETALSALTFYVAVYLFMNLGAFAIVALVRNVIHSEEIADYGGLIHRAPGVALCLAVILFSLIGLPPLAGFSGKILIFASLWNSGNFVLRAVLLIAGLNTAISLYYYLRVVKVMTIDPQPENALPITMPVISSVFIVAVTLPVLIFGIWWDELNRFAMAAASRLLS